jgi:hypothetical protein
MAHHDYPEDFEPPSALGRLLLTLLAAVGLGMVLLGVYALMPYVVLP